MYLSSPTPARHHARAVLPRSPGQRRRSRRDRTQRVPLPAGHAKGATVEKPTSGAAASLGHQDPSGQRQRGYYVCSRVGVCRRMRVYV